jgi:hypothetical protein
MNSSLATEVWLKPRNQLVPMIIRETETPPTIVLGKSLIFAVLPGVR